VASQFAALEVPGENEGVLRIPATDPLTLQARKILDWLGHNTLIERAT
jgi:gluconate kinase